MRLSLALSLILAFLGFIWGVQIMTATTSHIASERVLKDHARDIMDNIAALSLEQSENYLAIAHGAAALTERLVQSGVVGRSQDDLERYFLDQLVIYPQFAGIYIARPDGSFFYVSRVGRDAPGPFRTKIISHADGERTTTLRWRNPAMQLVIEEDDPDDTYDPRTRPWYRKAMAARSLIWTDPYIFFTAQLPGITTAAPIFDGSNELTGIIGIDIEIDELSIFLSRLRVGKNGRAFIINENGDIVAHYDLSKIFLTSLEDSDGSRLANISDLDDPLARKAFASVQWERTSDGLLQIGNQVFSNFEHQGEPYHVMFRPFDDPQWPWVIGVYLPESDYLGPLKETRFTSYLWALGISALATLLAIFLAGRIASPMRELERAALAVKNHDMSSNLSKGSAFKELHGAVDAFQLMRSEVSSNLRELKQSHLETIFRLAGVAESQDRDTSDHLQRISAFSMLIAEQLGLPAHQIELLHYASPMHDVGKLLIPDKILLKPGPLDDEERAVAKSHAVRGAEILSPPSSELMHAAKDIALHHHEHWDGSGYPSGLSEKSIPLFARIVAVADVFDTVTSNRCYRAAVSFTQGVRIINQGRGTHFDPAVVDAFMARLEDVERIYSGQRPLHVGQSS